MSISNVSRPNPFANNTYIVPPPPTPKPLTAEYIDPKDGIVKNGMIA